MKPKLSNKRNIFCRICLKAIGDFLFFLQYIVSNQRRDRVRHEGRGNTQFLPWVGRALPSFSLSSKSGLVNVTILKRVREYFLSKEHLQHLRFFEGVSFIMNSKSVSVSELVQFSGPVAKIYFLSILQSWNLLNYPTQILRNIVLIFYSINQ